MKGKEEKMFKVYRTTEDLEGDYKGLNVGKIFENEELAREYLDDSIPGIRACRFYQSIDFETIDNSSPRILNLKSEIEAIKKKQDEFNSKEYLQTITAAKHTCSSCGSAINRKAFLATRSGSITNFCPVCGEDLRPKGLRDRNQAYQDKIFEKMKEIRLQEQRILKEKGISQEERILVKC